MEIVNLNLNFVLRLGRIPVKRPSGRRSMLSFSSDIPFSRCLAPVPRHARAPASTIPACWKREMLHVGC